MGTKFEAFSYDDTKKSYSRILKLCDSIGGNSPICFPNKNQSIVTQQFIFNQVKSQVLFFLKGFDTDIFSHKDVQKYFINMVNNILDENTNSEPIMKLLINSDEDTFFDTAQKTGLLKTIDSVQKKHKTDIVQGAFININEILPNVNTNIPIVTRDNNIEFTDFDNILGDWKLDSFQLLDDKIVSINKYPNLGKRKGAITYLNASEKLVKKMKDFFSSLSSNVEYKNILDL